MIIEKENVMDRRIEDDQASQPPAPTFGDLLPWEWFAFADNGAPGAARLRLVGNKYVAYGGNVFCELSERAVVRLEPVRIDGECLVLRRVTE